MDTLLAQARPQLERWGVAPAQANVLEQLAKAIPVLSIILTLIISLSGISNGNVPTAPALEQVRTDVVNRINEVRPSHGLGPVGIDTELHSNAQAIAVRNANAGTEEPVPDPEGNLVVLQMNLPYSQLDATRIVDTFVNSPAHAELLFAPDYEGVGVGIANKGDHAWVVVQFTVPAPNSVESIE
ncbi:hypothetical protein CDES_11385 [Corynebacterium deserti GIMN1.010]|uniref:SCP domain-containing protein n=1 Tax=Corynebacterium deserti GIMN1.010 TaxID=931089 RepID=A0A0M3QA40_9CORY|nr:CAP domain-containing protein [Corynebacterium deserti]ALC06643.1 hypothetical protein CDES_11385 [Corynebacterium deserti GIMN1.010]